MLPLLEPDQTGYLKIKGHAIYYEVYGDLNSGKTPLLVVHGGPGSSHNYLLPLAHFSNHSPVIFYDQLGNGRSQIPESDKFYVKEYFVQELEQVIKQLKLKEVNLLGHSWGGMLAIEFLRKPRPVVKNLILSSAMIDSRLYNQSVEPLLAKLGKSNLALIKQSEKTGTMGSAEVEALNKRYILSHLYQGPERPIYYRSKNFNLHQYNKMWGFTEMRVTGNLKNWSGLKTLKSIKQPTLVISGKNDELTPAQNRKTVELLPNGKSVIIPDSSHGLITEQSGLYFKALREFLTDKQ